MGYRHPGAYQTKKTCSRYMWGYQMLGKLVSDPLGMKVM